VKNKPINWLKFNTLVQESGNIQTTQPLSQQLLASLTFGSRQRFCAQNIVS